LYITIIFVFLTAFLHVLVYLVLRLHQSFHFSASLWRIV